MRPTFSSALKRRPCVHDNGLNSERERAKSSIQYRSEALGQLPRISKEDFIKSATEWVSENQLENKDDLIQIPLPE